MSQPSDEALIDAAKRLHESEGEVEIHGPRDPLPDGRVSRGDEGAYVLAWVFVPYEQVGGG